MTVTFPQAPAWPRAGSAARRREGRILEGALLGSALVANWALAAAVASSLFSYTSLLLFGWLVVFIARLKPRAAVMMLPLMITRGATLLSLTAIEAGAYMPEVARTGVAGDASASFAVLTAVMLLAFTAVFSSLERGATAYARSPLLTQLTRLLRWPLILGCAAWGGLAVLHGLHEGFPLLKGVDRFFYRRYFGGGGVLPLLDNKFILAAFLGTVAFSTSAGRPSRWAAWGVFLMLTGIYFLFGDKFFTILSNAAYFMTPYLLRRTDLGRVVARLALPLVALICVMFGATLYIYSDYGVLSVDRTIQRVGERIAGQGELWFVATQDSRALVNSRPDLVRGYIKSLDDISPPLSALNNGVETYYFVRTYSPPVLRRSFQRNQGWVQLTMGYEAMALVMFGYVGAVLASALAGLITALAALYLRRALESEFPPSIILAVWTSLQVYLTVQQASLWTVGAPGQLKRFLLFGAFEALLFAFNRGQLWGRARPRPLQPA